MIEEFQEKTEDLETEEARIEAATHTFSFSAFQHLHSRVPPVFQGAWDAASSPTLPQ